MRVDCVRIRMEMLRVISETPSSFFQHLRDLAFVEKKSLRFLIAFRRRYVGLIRLWVLCWIFDLAYSNLRVSQHWGLQVATRGGNVCNPGFGIPERAFANSWAFWVWDSYVPNPILHLTCLDASISSIVITSGAISSLGICPNMLRFNTVIQEPYSMTLTPRSFLPRIVTRSSNQVAVSTQVHASRSEMLQVASEITGVF